MFTYPVGFISGGGVSGSALQFITHVLNQQGSISSTFTMTRPNPMNSGDLMLSLVAKDGLNNILPPSGWTLIEQEDEGNRIRFEAHFKVAGSSEPSTYLWTGDGQEWVGAILRITGHLSGNPINVSGVAGRDDSSPRCPSVVTWIDGCLIIRGFGADNDSIEGVDLGFPSSHTGIFVNISSSGIGSCSAGGAHTTQTTKGSTGSASFSLDNGEDHVGITIAITPAGTIEVPNYFGDGTDGAKTVTTAEELTASQDGNPVIKHYTTLTINSGQSLTTNNRTKALVIYTTGDCTINGTLKMDDRGASAAASQDLDLSRFQIGGSGGGASDDPLFPDETNQEQTGDSPGIFTQYKSSQVGGAGGAAGAFGGGAATGGSAGIGTQTGGGGGGGGSDPAGKAGAAGTAFSGGAGAGAGGGGGNTATVGAGGANGGAGGVGGDSSGSGGGGGGGNGNPAGAGGPGAGGPAGEAGDSGTGGTIYLIVGGDLTIGGSAVISADDTGTAGQGSIDGGGGGGGAGGGRIIILYKGTLSNTGTIRANGGTRGAGSGGGIPPGGVGGHGGAGTITGPIQVT